MRLLYLILLALPFCANAQVYKCADDRGRITYQTEPCEGQQGKVLDIRTQGGDVMTAEQAADTVKYWERLAEEQRQERIDKNQRRQFYRQLNKLTARRPSQPAVSAQHLKRVCGSKWDTVNATNVSELQRALTFHESSRISTQEDVNELRCRINLLSPGSAQSPALVAPRVINTPNVQLGDFSDNEPTKHRYNQFYDHKRNKWFYRNDNNAIRDGNGSVYHRSGNGYRNHFNQDFVKPPYGFDKF